MNYTKTKSTACDYRNQTRLNSYIDSNGNSVYTVSIDINISEEGIHHDNQIENTIEYAKTGSLYRITSGESKSIVIDYSGETDIVGDFVRDEYGCWNTDEIIKNLNSLRAKEISVTDEVGKIVIEGAAKNAMRILLKMEKLFLMETVKKSLMKIYCMKLRL